MINPNGIKKQILGDNITTNDENIDKARASLYGVLGRLLGQELDSKFAEELYSIDFFDLLANTGVGFTKDKPHSFDFESLEVDFARLFIGPNPVSPPYASVYRSSDQRGSQLWGDKTGEVKRFMAHYGFNLNKPGIIPDHISILFEFMEKLIQKAISCFSENEQEAYEKSLKIQQQFFNTYIEPWIDTFLEQVKTGNPLPFYASITEYTRQFIAQEKILLKQ